MTQGPDDVGSPRSPAPLDAGSTRFRDTLVTRTIRSLEESGPLEDTQELREAAGRAPTREGQVVARAHALARRIGLLVDLDRLAAISRFMLVACALGVAALTWMLVSAVLGEGRRINVVMAWLGVLGPHLLSVLIWGLAALAPASGVLAYVSRGLGGLALWASSRPKWAGSHAPALADEATQMLREARALPWAFGLVNHGIWAAAFGVLLLVLYVAFAFRAYQLTWESTILSQAFFVDFIGTTGRPAALLGLPGADAAATGAADAAASGPLALWLMYCVLLYGLVPRLLLAAWSGWRWTQARNTLRIDFADPYYRRLFHRLDSLGTSVIVDPERAPPDGPSPPSAAGPGGAGGPPVWIAFELPPDLPWHAGGETPVEQVTGDSAGRQRVIDRLLRVPASRAVVVCSGATSPDRGTARFLRDAGGHAGAVAVLLVESPGDPRFHPQLWVDWLQACGLGHLPVFTRPEAARAWADASASTP